MLFIKNKVCALNKWLLAEVPRMVDGKLLPCQKFFAVGGCYQQCTSKFTWRYLQAQCDVAIPIVIILLEHIRHPLQANASLHKQIKAHRILSSSVVGSEQ
jgi:hypothetical protein